MKVKKISSLTFIIALVSSLQLASAYTTLKFAGCNDITDADFKVDTLVSNKGLTAASWKVSEPLKMAFDMDASGNTDVYFVQRFGALKKYDAKTKTVIDLAKLNPPTTGSAGTTSDGLLGIALDPAFKTNHWIFLYYTGDDEHSFFVSRFTLKSNSLDLTTEKKILKVPSQGLSQHTGGAMQFDADGNLWITVGENVAKYPAANTFDLRGKILRIKPKPIDDATVLTTMGPTITYDIPAGNLFPVGTAKTKPEIYVMGSRHPYSITFDAVRKGVTWGDVGPDNITSGGTEEHDFTTKPMNGGWPYFAGGDANGNQVTVEAGGGTVAAPLNPKAGDTALAALPPAIPAISGYAQSAAITGPVLYYNSNLPTGLKQFPAHFNGVWLVSDFNKGYIEALTLDAKGEKITAREKILANSQLGTNGVLDFQAGPDGSIYFVRYAGYRTTSVATGILKISYQGNPCPLGIINPLNRSNQERMGAQIHRSEILITAKGHYTLEFKNLAGQSINLAQGEGPTQYNLNNLKNLGVYFVTVNTSLGKFSTMILKD